MVIQPRRAPALGLVAISFALIAFMTLRPTQAIVVTPTFCVFCGPLGGVDFILNVILFVPLGISLRWATGRWRTTIIVGVVTTLMIETLQSRLIGGRDASLGDLLANTLGTLLGAWVATALFRWLNATGNAAHRYAAAFGIAAALVVTGSAFLLQPIVPRYPQWVQWTPLHPNTDPFRGTLLAVELKGRVLRPAEDLEAMEAFDTVTRSLTMRAQISSSGLARPTQRPAIVVRIVNFLEEGFALVQRGEAVAFRTHIAAVRVKLRPILVGLDGAFPTSPGTAEEFIIEAHSDPRAITVRRHGDGQLAVSVRRTVGLAWALVSPWDVALNERWWPVNAIWVGALIFPAAFFAIRSSRASRNSVLNSWWPVVLVIAALFAGPATGLSALGLGEWAGVLAGIAAAWPFEHWSAASDVPDLSARAPGGSIRS